MIFTSKKYYLALMYQDGEYFNAVCDYSPVELASSSTTTLVDFWRISKKEFNNYWRTSEAHIRSKGNDLFSSEAIRELCESIINESKDKNSTGPS